MVAIYKVCYMPYKGSKPLHFFHIATVEDAEWFSRGIHNIFIDGKVLGCKTKVEVVSVEENSKLHKEALAESEQHITCGRAYR